MCCVYARKKLAKFVSVLIAVLFVSISFAQDFEEESELVNLVEGLYDASTDSPAQVLTLLPPLTEQAQTKNWIHGMYVLGLLEARLHLALNDKVKTNQALQKLDSLELTLPHPNLAFELDVIKLDMLTGEASLDVINKLQTSLLSRIPQINDQNLVIRAYFSIGDSFTLLDIFDDALFYLNESYERSLIVNDEFAAVNALNSLANVYSELEEYQSAIDYYKKVYEILEKNDNQYGMSILQYNMAVAYQRDGDINQAKPLFNKAIEFGGKSDFDAIVVYSKQRLAEIGLQENDWDQALALYKSVEVFHAEKGNSVFLYEAYVGLADAYIGLKQFEQAELYLQKMQDLLSHIQLPKRTLKYDRLNAKFAYAQNRYQLAYDILIASTELQEDIYIAERKQNIARSKVQFDTERIRQQNATLVENQKLNNLVLEETKKRQTLFLIAAFLGFILFFVVLGVLIMQMRNRNQFKRLAHIDFLTESPNRRAIIENANIVFEQAKLNNNLKFVVALADLDDFKKINDSFGHDKGDQILQAFANACKEKLRGKDRYGRYGGEEWLIILHDADKQKITNIFYRIRDFLNETESLEEEKPVTFSMGVAEPQFNVDRNIHDVIARADKRLYKAKLSGKDQLILNDANPEKNSRAKPAVSNKR